MSWLVWRQHRLQAAIAGTLLGTLAVLLLVTGLRIASQYRAARASCTANGDCSNLAHSLDLGVPAVAGIVVMTVGVPLLIGLFWGAPLAREFETGTSQFAWTQGVTRRRWPACVRDAGFRGYLTYQPADRFWIFQGIEAGIFVALAAALIAVAFWVIRRRDA